MNEDAGLPVPAMQAKPPVLGPSDEVIARFQGDMEKLVGGAMRTLDELCEMAQSESVRLNAATNILAFAGLRPYRRRNKRTIEDDVSDSVTTDLVEALARLEKNKPGITQAIGEAARETQERERVIDVDVVEPESEDGPA